MKEKLKIYLQILVTLDMLEKKKVRDEAYQAYVEYLESRGLTLGDHISNDLIFDEIESTYILASDIFDEAHNYLEELRAIKVTKDLR